jgi:hypothetical protein
MPIADRMPPGPMLALSVVLAVILFGGLVWLILLLYRWFERCAQSDIRQAYQDLKPHWPARKGDVTVRFHTYFGFLVWHMVTEHRFALPADEARVLLSRLNYHNLRWGFLCELVVAVPLVSLINYWAQLRSIRRQEVDDSLM